MGRARIGSCCGTGGGGGIGGDLDSMTSIATFLSLVDTGATVKDYQREFGWSRDRLNLRLKDIRLYRRTLMCSKKIEKVIRACKTPDDVEKSQPEINRLRRLMWRDGPLEDV